MTLIISHAVRPLWPSAVIVIDLVNNLQYFTCVPQVEYKHMEGERSLMQLASENYLYPTCTVLYCTDRYMTITDLYKWRDYLMTHRRKRHTSDQSSLRMINTSCFPKNVFLVFCKRLVSEQASDQVC